MMLVAGNPVRTMLARRFRWQPVLLVLALLAVRLSAAIQPGDDDSSGAFSSPVQSSLAGGQALSAAQAPLATCVTAIANLSDPAKLSTLRGRAANPRLKKIIYWLAAARDTGADPAEVIDQAQAANQSAGTPRAALVKASLLRNLKICDGLGMLTPENRIRLRHGSPPIVTRGPYTGQTAEVDHIVPLAHAFEIGNELANLEMLPAALNRAKSAKVGERQLAVARQMHDAGLITDATMAKLQARFRPAATTRFEVVEPDPPTVAAAPPVSASLVTAAPPTPTPPAGEAPVWVNTGSHIYHRPHSRWYGGTEAGKYLGERDALAEGDRAARNGQ